MLPPSVLMGNGKEVTALLLDRRGDEITITEEVVKGAAGNGKAVMALLLDRREDEITITEEMVKAGVNSCIQYIQFTCTSSFSAFLDEQKYFRN